MLDSASKEELLEFGKAVGKGIQDGMPLAADKEPNSFLMLCAVITIAIAAIVLCMVVLKYMHDSKKAEAAERNKREEREVARERERDADDKLRAAACHASHKEVVDKTTDAISRSTSAVESSNRLGERCVIALESNTRIVEKCVGLLGANGQS